MNHKIKKRIYQEMKKEITHPNTNICSSLKKENKEKVYSKHNLYKFRKTK